LDLAGNALGGEDGAEGSTLDTENQLPSMNSKTLYLTKTTKHTIFPLILTHEALFLISSLFWEFFQFILPKILPIYKPSGRG
jgi:hypothetical protein